MLLASKLCGISRIRRLLKSALINDHLMVIAAFRRTIILLMPTLLMCRGEMFPSSKFIEIDDFASLDERFYMFKQNLIIMKLKDHASKFLNYKFYT